MHLQKRFVRYLRYYNNFVACEEVSTYYNCISDVLALDINKGIVIEYEFKSTIQDLKNDFKKAKYQKQKKNILNPNWDYISRYEQKPFFIRYIEPLRPHKFYFVMHEKLYNKHIKYLHTLKDCGIIIYNKGYWDFKIVKKCFKKVTNTYNPNVILKHILARISWCYLDSLNKIDALEESTKFLRKELEKNNE